MRDKISEQRVKTLHPYVMYKVIAAVEEIERNFPVWIAVRITQARRYKAEQDALYAQGRTKPGKIVTKAKWYQTYHFYGLAVDFAILYDKDRNGKYEEISWSMVRDGDVDGIPDWAEVVDIFIKYGFGWGGNWRTFKDYPHVEMTFGYKYPILYTMYQNKDFIPGTDFLNLKIA